MPYVDQIVMCCLAAGLAASVVVQWRRALRGRQLVAAVFGLYFGVTLVVMLAAHCLDILWGVAHRAAAAPGTPFTYDWRTYSLLLFGVLLIVQGVGCARAAVRMGPTTPAARREVLRRTALVLAIVLPIIPVHAFFGYLMTAVCTLTLAAVALGGAAKRSQTAAALAASTT